jgi:DNA polymerase III delta prime subunit
MTDKHKLWVEKYRPQTLSEYVFHDDAQRKAFERFVSEKTIPHLLFSGVQGSGKTTIAQILINEMDVEPTDILSLNASDENSVDVMRDKIKSFITTFAMGDFKIVLLDEADYISVNGQGVLRKFLEEYIDQARFILTCNYENKIIPPLKSRLQQFRFKAGNKEDITEYVAKILLAEKINFGLEVLDKYVAVGYPDIRKIVNLVQQNTHDGKLDTLASEREVGDYKFELLNLIEKGAWLEARKLTCGNVATEEWEDVYRFLYENAHKVPQFSDKDKWEAAIVIIADHLYKHSICADPEINAAAMYIRLGQL